MNIEDSIKEAGNRLGLEQTPDTLFTPEIGVHLVRISSIPGFNSWMHGQTIPYVGSSSTPVDWAYYWDFIRFAQGLPVVD